jgi:hypothetical protein
MGALLVIMACMHMQGIGTVDRKFNPKQSCYACLLTSSNRCWQLGR